MKVEKIIELKGNDVFSVHIEAIVSDALSILNEKNIGALMVLDSSKNIQALSPKGISCAAATSARPMSRAWPSRMS